MTPPDSASPASGLAESALPQGEGSKSRHRYNVKTLQQAKALRLAMTAEERRLWKYLRAGRFGPYKFRRQRPIGPYIVDFVCPQHRLIIEVDGSQHAESAKDQKRTIWLEAQGYKVMRFWNTDVLKDTQAVLETILAALQKHL